MLKHEQNLERNCGKTIYHQGLTSEHLANTNMAAVGDYARPRALAKWAGLLQMRPLPAASSCANSWTHQSAGFVAGDRLTLRTNLSMIMFTVRRTLQQIDREIDR